MIANKRALNSSSTWQYDDADVDDARKNFFFRVVQNYFAQ